MNGLYLRMSLFAGMHVDWGMHYGLLFRLGYVPPSGSCCEGSQPP